MNEFSEVNRRYWDEVVALNEGSEFYDVASFRAGRSSLLPVEREEVGDVRGKTLLHLMCHFGLDTMSWSRAGASVTGVDFSHNAIATARLIALQQGIEARFIHSDIYDLPRVLDGNFDIVFTSYGVLCWLHDLGEWARIAARYVKPAGIFYIVDDHPLAAALDDEADGDNLRLAYPYFASAGPLRFDDAGNYAELVAGPESRTTYEYPHSLGEVVSSLIEAGLQVEFLHEFPFCAWRRLASMTKGDDGYYRLPQGSPETPFIFSLRARKGH